MARKKRSSSVRKLLILLVIAGLGFGLWLRTQSSAEASAVFTTTTVERGDMSQIVTATGQLEPVTSIQVGSQVSGLITDVFVDFNSPVKAGQLIARIDPATYEQRLRQVEADLASSQASYALVHLNTERTRELREKNLVSQQELDQAEANLKQAAANLLTREASVENARVDLDRCSIYAPVDGIVLDRQIEVGRTVAASLNAPVLFIIAADLTQMQINALISEADIGQIVEGQRVNFTVDAFPNREFRGRITQIRNSPTTSSNVVNYQTIIQVTNDDLKLKPGMTANVSVIVAERQNTLRLANSALRARVPAALLPPAETTSSTTGATSPAPNNRDAMQQLMRDAGFTPGSGAPSPEVRARMQELAKERGITLPGGMAGGSGAAGAPGGPGGFGTRRRSPQSPDADAVTTRTVYKLGGSAQKPEVLPVTVKLGITDGTITEVIEGLEAGDKLVTSALITSGKAAKAVSTPAASASNPFAPQAPTRRR
ncbi:hypothetical protein AXK12_07345 [Cephaloticoccus capnophilus]|uniref:Uncharacterized protein n=1 Tax=Cephaloticoccus capnophilus TaxID=1548208 RepID=A0A139SIB0_9BACT|nr:efflux RND transporter periplasmic adaptor subunit [Cephaloticoccus capnophilus]KXU34287.1 hypothetical protein AXK12_07345 [Cephaloticoccus capnophilus]